MENMAKSYIREIPEGYEARIEGNKVIIELAETEDERAKRMLTTITYKMSQHQPDIFTEEENEWFNAYLEKQKEPHYTKRNALFDKCVAECDPAVMKEVSDEIDEMLKKEQKPKEPSDEELERHQKELYDFKVFAAKQAKEHHISFVHDFEWNNFCAELLSYFHEQKPNSTEDMPYITDEHFYEREPVDSFKYKLAEYMTKCCTKKEGPYGYEYGISAETVLKMAEEELLKRGVVQKPAEWSEEDEKMSNKEYFDWLYERLIHVYNESPNVDFIQSFKKRTDWLIQNTIGWISVKDRLPEENKWVFVCVDMQGVPQCVGLGYLKDGEWCDDENDNGFCVDYWMEIPKLPKEEEK